MITTDTYATFRETLTLSDEINLSSPVPADEELIQRVLPPTKEDDGTALKPGAYIARLLGLGWRLHPTWGKNGERMGDVPNVCHFTKRLEADPTDPEDRTVYALADYVNGQAWVHCYRTQIELWQAMAESFIYGRAITADNPHPSVETDDPAWGPITPDIARPTGWTLEDEITAQAEYRALL